MNEKNVEYLKENLKYMGFGGKLNNELENNIRQQFPEFVLKQSADFSKEKFEANLHFKRSENTDMYFFNRWDAVLKNDIGKNEQSFYLTNGRGITFKEGYNLLSGRAVNTDLTNKEGQKYNAWVQIDFSEKEANGNYKQKLFHENYGYDLAATLQKFPIKELGDEVQKERLLLSLQRGNIQSVTMERNGQEEKMFIAANPQFKSLHVYDSSMNKVYNLVQGAGHKTSVEKEASQKAAQHKTMNQNAADEEAPAGQKKKAGKKISTR